MTEHVDRAAAWIYRGVWASVVALFRVPPEPPSLPTAGEAVRSIRPAAGYLSYLKFFFWLALIPGDVIPVAGWLAISVASPIAGVVLILPLLFIVIAPDVISYVAIHLRYDTTWYVLTDRSLRIRRGIWVIHETTITFENVQNVEVRQGPVQRHFGIADVIVQTAGGGGRSKNEGKGASGAHIGILAGLDDAPSVRDLILDRVKRSRTAGLGDEHHDHHDDHPHGAAVPGFSPAHLAVLRDISASVQRL